MRLLSDEEMDSIFGGGDDTIQNLDTVSVQGTRVRDTGGQYLPGFSAFREETYGGCSWCADYYAFQYRVIKTALPSKNKIKCVANATALPGQPYKSGYKLEIVNSRVWRDPLVSGVDTDWVHRNGTVQGSGAPANSQQVSAITVPSTDRTSGTTLIYAGGLEGSFIPAYTDYTTATPGTMSGATTTEENLAFTVGHELYHQYFGPGNEMDANGWGVEALKKFRAGAASGC